MARFGFRFDVASLAMLLIAGCPAGSTSVATAGPGGPGGPRVGSSGSTGGSGGSGGTSSGTAGVPNPPSPFVDGGYVFCTLPQAADAGASDAGSGDGGPTSWICQLGTTICDLGGTIGSCFQCQSDGDCQDEGLPGYDPRRPRCDLTSGVPGYQGFCQECLGNNDCVGNPAGTLCDLNPNYPLGALEQAIDAIGFETCGTLITDCRLDGGPPCNLLNQSCDTDAGLCVTRSFDCGSDKDCAGLLSPSYLPAPHCVNGACNSCAAGTCPAKCFEDPDCGGFWPVCEDVKGGRDPIGVCGCDADWQCGDGGLVCLPPGPTMPIGVGACGVPCTAANFPPCASLFPDAPICEPDLGECVACTSDLACRDLPFTGGPSCLAGRCLCNGPGDAGCPAGQTCQPANGAFPGTCAVTLPVCAHSSCLAGGFCNWEAGDCEPGDFCLKDSDCDFPLAFCGGADSGSRCMECRTSVDCAKSWLAGLGQSDCVNGQCAWGCATDQDCLGNGFGAACRQQPGGGICGCGRDLDCAGIFDGARCDTDTGTCGCATSADCASGLTCSGPGGPGSLLGECRPGCNSNADCAPDTYCDPEKSCRPRCDDGHLCIGTDLLCDHGDVGGLNEGVETWCYQCLHGGDCAGSDGCHQQSCGPCADSSECAAGRICVGGSCQPRCDDGACPGASVCDTVGVGGYGSNVCLACVTAADCPAELGCNHFTHVCGSCLSPDTQRIPPEEGFDCPAEAVCSTYWQSGEIGACLASCDRRSCPASQPHCEVIPSLTADHKYCVECLRDADCIDAGTGAWCDVSVNHTFACQLAP